VIVLRAFAAEALPSLPKLLALSRDEALGPIPASAIRRLGGRPSMAAVI
jgi:hypothetical protein